MGLWDDLTGRDEESRPGRQRNRTVTTDADRKARAVEEAVRNPHNAGLRRQRFVSPYVPCNRYAAIIVSGDKAREGYAIAPDEATAQDLILDAFERAFRNVYNVPIKVAPLMAIGGLAPARPPDCVFRCRP